MADGQTCFLILLTMSILADRVVHSRQFSSHHIPGWVFYSSCLESHSVYGPAHNFLKNTPLSPYESPTQLLTSGPFRFSRNPIYLGMALILTGASVYMGSVIPFLSPLLFIAIMEIRFIPREELMLVKIYREEYREYTRNVRKWI